MKLSVILSIVFLVMLLGVEVSLADQQNRLIQPHSKVEDQATILKIETELLKTIPSKNLRYLLKIKDLNTDNTRHSALAIARIPEIIREPQLDQFAKQYVFELEQQRELKTRGQDQQTDATEQTDPAVTKKQLPPLLIDLSPKNTKEYKIITIAEGRIFYNNNSVKTNDTTAAMSRQIYTAFVNKLDQSELDEYATSANSLGLHLSSYDNAESQFIQYVIVIAHNPNEVVEEI